MMGKIQIIYIYIYGEEIGEEIAKRLSVSVLFRDAQRSSRERRRSVVSDQEKCSFCG